ncbi:M1 family metallopeptidase [Mucilaginibacter sp. FT3.2]|uniref:M1 family metallopeptidase n=1 Tax=Mucilaginibacter sp. FT3.2 TaxID=2723090 RepID=UPI00161C4470|nr:M1 family metallopeptidase [Mucilaginibacter sp. FT3.2]MBB6232948.1 hypothetical protein [Mucilaginibacter sp. FT3.2]
MRILPGFCLIVYSLLYIAQVSFAQTTLSIPRNIQQTYINGTRDKSGAPGKSYWQNREDYSIKVTFDPLTRKLTGTVGIDFTNNSPDTLNKVWFKLYPNLYQEKAPRAISVETSDLTTGVKIENIHIDGQKLDSAKRVIRGTNMVLRGKNILPGQRVHYDIEYQYTLNKGSFIRTGQIDSGAFFIAYFFPRLAVYDDVDGWNTYPYTGQYEFYNDFCHFKAEITVPGDYQVWATGNLKNADEVYTPRFAERIKKAGETDSVIDVVTAGDLDAGSITHKSKTNTWKFDAENVTDMAFGMGNHYIWKSTSLVVDPVSKRRVRVDAVFNPNDKTYVPIINYARKSVEIISAKFPGIPYPYAHETIFDGPDEMEFPMMVDNRPFDNSTDAVELTAHEIFHTLFPFYVGTNETKYSFMDEGWATFAEFAFHPMIEPSLVENYNISDVNNSAGTEQDLPIMTLTPQLAGAARFADKDLKPALGYLYVKELVGDEMFFKALNYYISQWAGKHPTPYDFFNCMNTATGQNLNWFWNSWFFQKGIPDLAINKVEHQGQSYTVTISNNGTEMVPVHLTVYYNDGSTGLLSATIAVWSKGAKTATIKFKATHSVQKIILGGAYDADVNKKDNVWPR